MLVEDGTGRSLDVSRSLISVNVVEGTVLRVPVTEEGGPDWRLAEPDEELRRRRLAEAAKRSGTVEEEGPRGGRGVVSRRRQ